MFLIITVSKPVLRLLTHKQVMAKMHEVEALIGKEKWRKKAVSLPQPPRKKPTTEDQPLVVSDDEGGKYITLIYVVKYLCEFL